MNHGPRNSELPDFFFGPARKQLSEDGAMRGIMRRGPNVIRGGTIPKRDDA